MRGQKRAPFAHNTAWLVAQDGYTLALGLVAGVFSARYLGPGGYGLLSYSMSLVALFSAFCQLGLNASVMQALVATPLNAGRVIGSALALRTAAAALAQAGLFFLISLTRGAGDLLLTLTLLQGMSLFFDARLVLDTYFQSRLEARKSALAHMAGMTALCALRAALILTRADIMWFALATGAQSCVSMLTAFALFGVREKLSLSKSQAKQLLSYGKYYMLAGVASALYAQIDRLMIGGMLTNADVGWYAVAAFVALTGRFLPDALITSARPLLLRLRSEDKGAFTAAFQALALGVLALGTALGVALLLIGPAALSLVYGAAYAPAGRILRILSFTALFSAINHLRDAYFLASGLHAYTFVFALLGAGASALLNLHMIPLWGVAGAAFSTLFAYGVTCLLAPLMFAKTRPFARLLLASPARWRACLRLLRQMRREAGA